MRYEDEVEAIGVGIPSSDDAIVLGPESYKNLAQSTGFHQQNLEKVIRLGQVLGLMASEPNLNAKVALKGGTAINLISDPIRRLSVDLDFNYVGAVERETMLDEKPRVLASFSNIARRLDYNPEPPRDAHGGSSFLFRYRNSLGSQDNIEIDVSWTTRVPLGPLQVRSVWMPEGLNRPSALVVCNEELAVGKLRALVDRVAARDVFDTGYLPELVEPWPTQRLKALFVLYTGTLPNPLSDYTADRLDRLSEAEFQSKLVPVLSVSAKTDRVTMISRAKEVLEPMLALKENESEFVQRLQVGDYQPELVLPFDLNLAERLRRHPALLWKVQNAAQFNAQHGR